MHAGRNIKNYVNELEQLVEQGNEAASVLKYLDKTTPAEFVPYMDEAANDA
jgi:hypothetical protein